jgi:hypothetical protein
MRDGVESLVPAHARELTGPTGSDTFEWMEQPIGGVDDFGRVRAARATYPLWVSFQRGRTLDAAVLESDLHPAACGTDATNAVDDLSPGLVAREVWIGRRDWSSDRDRHVRLSSGDGGLVQAYSDVF